MKFCPKCFNLLQKNTEMENSIGQVNTLKFVCGTCQYSEPATPSDTLMISVSLREEQSLYKSEIYLNAASKDRIAPLVEKKCKNCDETIIKQIHLMTTGETVYVCPKCESRFI